MLADVVATATSMRDGPLSVTVYVAALYALHAMPRELHTHLVAPLYTRLRAGRAGV